MRKFLRKLVITILFICIILTFSYRGVYANTFTRKVKAAETTAAMSTYLYGLKATASSTLNGGDYDVYNLFDEEFSSAWVEGVNGNGIGESVSITFDEGTVITSLTICPGYFKSEKLFYANAAPSKITVSGGKSKYSFDISDCADSYEDKEAALILKKPMVLTDGILKITIDDVREGYKYEDTCISEMTVNGFYAGTEEAELAASGKQMQVISETALDAIMSESMYLVQSEMDDPEDLRGTYKMSDSDTGTKAFLLYYYQYNVADNRIRYSDDYMYHIVAETDVTDIYEELTGEKVDEAAWQTILNMYVEDWTDEGVHFSASGDFGGGYRYPDPHATLYMRNGQLIIRGKYCTYDNDEQEYLPSNSFLIYCAVDGGPAGMEGYQINKVVVY